MRYQVLPISVDYEKVGLAPTPRQDHGEENFAPNMTCYLSDNTKEIEADRAHPAVVIFPGGGYHYTSDREAEPIALQFVAAGIHAFVVRYSCAPMRFPGALLEASEAVATVRRNAKEWNVDPNRIFVCGFSAGGHLAASLGVYWNADFVREALGFSQKENQPNGLILCYPVICGQEKISHVGSLLNLLGHHPDEREQELVACEKHVSADTPPTFLFHTREDSAVPVVNSLRFADALEQNGIPFEMHIYPHGPHGLALASPVTGYVQPECQQWIRDAIRWIG